MQAPRKWDYADAVEGMRLILWGLFKKCAVADGVAFWVDKAYTEGLEQCGAGASLLCLFGAICFSIQIYGDFSGYSDIAKGTAKLFGIQLMDNFLYPFFSRNAIELWQRWHRSLMQWLTTYVYIPLGGSRTGNRYVNVMTVFLISGLWHGADWTFVLWGVACGVWYIVSALFGARKYKPMDTPPAGRHDLPSVAVTFVMFTLVFILFRAPTLEAAVAMYSRIGVVGAGAICMLVEIFGEHFFDESERLEHLSRNPYFYFDNYHYRPEMARIIMDTVYGKRQTADMSGDKRQAAAKAACQ